MKIKIIARFELFFFSVEKSKKSRFSVMRIERSGEMKKAGGAGISCRRLRAAPSCQYSSTKCGNFRIVLIFAIFAQAAPNKFLLRYASFL